MDDLIGIDFETYYSADYSLGLAKYNTSEYVRDKQFLIHGCGFYPADGKPYWIAGHDAALKECQILGLDRRPVVAHNMAFDGFVLHEHAGIHCGYYCDTLSMARAAIGHHAKHHLNNVAQLLGIGAKTEGLLITKGKRELTEEESRILGDYCINDVDLCVQIFKRLHMFIPKDEMDLIDITQRMFCDPVLKVDTELAYREYELEIRDKKKAVAEADTEKEILMSNEKFAQLLRDYGVDPPMKISARTGKEAYAFAKTDPGFKELLVHENEAVRFAAEARKLVKSTINETRALRLYVAGKDGKPLPILLNYSGAHTFRWSGGNKLNLQNLPRGGNLRLSILAPEHHQILVLDLSQIEARLTVWLAKQMDILRAFAAFDAGTGEDVYKLMASKVYNKPITDISADERFIGKICVLGLGFGMGWQKLQMTLAMGFMGKPIQIDNQMAQHIVSVYRRANGSIVLLWDRLNVMLQHMAGAADFKFKFGPITFMHKMIELPNGLALKYPGLQIDDMGQASYVSRYGRQSIWGGMLLENIVQALARCVISEQMLKIHRFGYRIASMTHDEIISVVHNDMAEYALKHQTQIMTTPPTWAPDLPLAVEGGYDVRYSK